MKEVQPNIPKIKKDTAPEVTAKETPAFLKSSNFWVGILSIFIGFAAANGIDFGIVPENFLNDIAGKNTMELAFFIAMNFFNPVIKLFKKIQSNTWNWAWLYSENFQTQMLSIAAVVIGYYMDSVEVGFVVAIIANIWNIVKKRVLKQIVPA